MMPSTISAAVSSPSPNAGLMNAVWPAALQRFFASRVEALLRLP
jgi:hypothetical protein